MAESLRLWIVDQDQSHPSVTPSVASAHHALLSGYQCSQAPTRPLNTIQRLGGAVAKGSCICLSSRKKQLEKQTEGKHSLPQKSKMREKKQVCRLCLLTTYHVHSHAEESSSLWKIIS
eukprot:c10801_g1_i1 orf=591-944(-)